MARPAAPGVFICSMAWLRLLCLPTLAQRIRRATVPPIDSSGGYYLRSPPDSARQSPPEEPQPVPPHDPFHILGGKTGFA